MADTSSPVESASAAPGEKRAASRPPLAKAAESGDPAVHKLLADRQTAQMNAAALDQSVTTDEDRVAAKAEVDRLSGELAKLGFE